MEFTLTQFLVAKDKMKNATRNFLKCNVRVVYIFCCLLDNKNIKTNKEDMMKKIVTLGILMICLLVAVRMTTFANAESIEEASFVDADDVVDEKNVERGDSGIIEDMLKEEEDIQYYAYLTLDDADPSLALVIIEARNRIIFRQSWVADGLKGYVHDRNGDVIEEVPQFSDLFPEDWDIPVLPVEVDLSYYGK